MTAMDGDGGVCGMVELGRAIAWPDGWFARQRLEERSVRTGSTDPGVHAIVHGRRIRVRRVQGWRVAVDPSGHPGRGEGFTRRPIACPPHDARERTEAVERIRGALDTLPGPYRQALVLVYVEGSTHREAAIRLAIPLGTAHAWVRRGLRALRLAHASLASTSALEVADVSGRLVRDRREARRTSKTSEVTKQMAR